MRLNVNKIKSYSPLVKKASHDQLREQLSFYVEHTKNLEKRNDEWAREVRELRLGLQRIKEYDKWIAQNYPTPAELNDQKARTKSFTYTPLISVIMPVYNTDPEYLKVCINSVIDQTYENWELCIFDDGSTKTKTIDVLKDYSDKPNIRIGRSDTNAHISVASNNAISMAEGEFIALLDHDDFLWPNALYETVKLLQSHPDADLIYSDEDKIDDNAYRFVHMQPYFKPDWSPHLLESINYINHFAVLRTGLVRQIGGFDRTLVGAQDWDLLLRISENTKQIFHIPTVLYSWRCHDHSTASSITQKPYVLKNQQRALMLHQNRLGIKNYKIVYDKTKKGCWFILYKPERDYKVSIVIPSKDKKDYLERCLSSIINKTSYSNYEIVIVDTGSVEKTTLEYYAHLNSVHSKKVRIVYWRHTPFNYSLACNFGAKQSKGDYLIMLNNDTEVITPDWMQDMLGYAQQKAIGAVGVKLLYPDSNCIQHAGITLGIGSDKPVAGHAGYGIDENTADSLASVYLNTVREVSGVTAACLMVSKHKFWEVGGFDPVLRVTFNDVDLNLKLGQKGYSNLYLPFVMLYHHESVSVGRVFRDRDMRELVDAQEIIRKKWSKIINKDKYYNINFYRLSSNFGLDIYTKRPR